MYLEISLVFLSAAVLLIAVVTAPLLLQFHKFFKGLVLTQEILQKSLPGILQDLEEASANIKQTAVTVNSHMDGISLALGKIRNMLHVITELENVMHIGMRLPFFKALQTTSAVAKGVWAFLNVYATGRRSA